MEAPPTRPDRRTPGLSRNMLALISAVVVGIGALGVLIPACSGRGPQAPTRAAVGPEALAARPRIEGEPAIRVRLDRTVEQFGVGGPADVTVVPIAVPSEIRILRTPLEISCTDRYWVILDGVGITVRLRRGGKTIAEDALRISAVGTRPLEIEGFVLIGELLLHGRRDVSDGVMDIVEHVPMETYLPGVIAKELYPNWHLEAFKAQAIAARSYALHERQRRLSLGDHFDVMATTQDQVYGGATTHQTALRAVRESAGIVLTDQDGILRAYYSSTCGGRAASARDTWPTTPGFEFNLAGPIQAHDREHFCMSSKRYRWTTSRPRDQLGRRLAAYGREHKRELSALKQIARIEVARLNEVGRPARYRIFDVDGREWDLSAEQLRLACNAAATGLPEIKGEDRVFSGDMEFVVSDEKVVIRGRGFGHGVGLCQFGAQGLASRGWQAPDIVLLYYPGAQLERAY